MKRKLQLISTLIFVFTVAFFQEVVVAQDMGMHHMPGMETSKVKRPLTAASNESTKAQLALSKAEGNAVDQCTDWVRRQAQGASGLKKAGEYKITYAITSPEGWYNYSDQKLVWQQPMNANAHLWVFVQDGADGRVVAPLNVNFKITDAKGNLVLAKDLPYAWMPLIDGYGANINLPADGKYNLQIQVSPPDFRRHDPYNGDRFTDVTKATIPFTISLRDIASKKPLTERMEQNMDLSGNTGKAYANTLKQMYKQANDGRDTLFDDYKVAYAIEYAEGYWDYEKGVFRYKVENDLSGLTNAHVEVAALDRNSGRFLFNMNVSATLYKNKEKIGTKIEPFMWHPWLYHYGENWRVPRSGNYDLRVHIDPPAYRRYGKRLGNRFAKPIDLTFKNIKIKTGQK